MEKYHCFRPLESHDEFRSSSEEMMEDGVLLGTNVLRNERCTARKGWIKAALWALILAVYTTLVVVVTWNRLTHSCKESRRHGNRFLATPVNDYIVYESHAIEPWEEEDAPKYFGEPSEELDKNWHNLFKHQNLGLSPELMKELGRQDEGIKLPDGTYYGSMMVFHHLHCLKNIQHSLHPKYYELDNLDEHQLEKHWGHTDHCLHMLMDALMCQGDTTLITMLWQDNLFRPAAKFSSPHECVNWDRLMEWIVPNSRDLFGDEVLVHPKHGPLFSGTHPTKGFLDSINNGGFGKVSSGI